VGINDILEKQILGLMLDLHLWRTAAGAWVWLIFQYHFFPRKFTFFYFGFLQTE